MSTTLERLARAHGIATSYRDGFGRERRVGRASLRALLASMGVAAEPDAVAASLFEVEAAPWLRLLPPVLVQRVSEPATIPVHVDPAERGGLLEWSLLEEGGVRQSGRTRLADLRESAAAELAVGRRLRLDLVPPSPPGPGYHRLEARIEPDGEPATTTLIRVPEACLGLDSVLGVTRPFGLTCQVQALRSARGHGIGDLLDLARLGEQAAAEGCGFVGVNPLHALFPADPGHFGPYSPSSRLFLNVAVIALDTIPELADCPQAQAVLAEAAGEGTLARLRDAELVDHPAAFHFKRAVLEHLFAHFQARHLGAEPTERGRAFLGFVREMGEDLARHALFEALHERMLAEHGAARWAFWTWPEGLRGPGGDEARRFAEQGHERVRFFQYLQWLADGQLEVAQARMRQAGMAIGLYRDLAVAVNPAGAAVWADDGAILRGVSVGAPPDAFSPDGQNWGLAPLSPRGLAARAFAPFVEAVRQNMRHAGALRIDHVMGLSRLFLIPDGMSGTEGAYVAYPFEDLLGILALESHRQGCLVIGEDLGTVPEGFRERLLRAGILSCRVLLFERERDGALKPPSACPEAALVSASTHDLPTLRGYWQGRDLDWRLRLDPQPDPAAHDARRAERAGDRRALLDALDRALLLPQGVEPGSPPDELSLDLLVALHRLLGRWRGRLLAVQLEDALFDVEQVNLPGTVDEHPNWRRRLRVPLESLFDDPTVQAVLRAVRAERGGDPS